MTDDVLLYLMGQICELKTCRGRSSLGDRIRRHRSKLAGAAQRSAARSAGAERGSADNCDEVIIRLSAAGLAPWQETQAAQAVSHQKESASAEDAIALKLTQKQSVLSGLFKKTTYKEKGVKMLVE